MFQDEEGEAESDLVKWKETVYSPTDRCFYSKTAYSTAVTKPESRSVHLVVHYCHLEL